MLRLPQKQRLNPYIYAAVAVAAESIQMIFILGLPQPIDQAFSLNGSKTSAEILVREIAFPMIILNGLGCGLFILIVRNILREAEHIGALQAKSALRLASLTLKHMRQGLDINAAMETCKILYHEIKPLAVAITDQVHVLAYVGNLSAQHVKHGHIKTAATRKVINTGELLVVRADKELAINNSSRAAIIAPLKCNNTTIGTLKFYYADEREMNSVSIELVSGLVDNAIKYGSKDVDGKERIKIELKNRFDMICIKISNSGKGISADKIELLGKQRIKSEQGTGLGIYNAKHLLVMMYGAEASMRFKSEEGKGTEVMITIPKREHEVVRNGTTKIAHSR